MGPLEKIVNLLFAVVLGVLAVQIIIHPQRVKWVADEKKGLLIARILGVVVVIGAVLMFFLALIA